MHVALGTTLGHICIVTHSQLFTGGQQRLSNIIAHRWKAHEGCVNGLCIGMLLLLLLLLCVCFTDSTAAGVTLSSSLEYVLSRKF